MWDTTNATLTQGKRPIYTHFWREGFVNIAYRDFGYILEEIQDQLGWRKADTINYYIRKGEIMQQRILHKLLLVKDRIKSRDTDEQEAAKLEAEKIIREHQKV